MILRTRHMRPEDVRQCTDVIARHPVLGPRYGGDIRHLAPALLRLLGSEGASAVLLEDAAPNPPRLLPTNNDRDKLAPARIVGFGFDVFVSDAYIQKIKTPPFFWIGPDLARSIVAGTSPVLSAREVREANSTAGLNLIAWEYLPVPEYEANTSLLHTTVSTFVRLHLGYRIKEMFAFQAENARRLQWVIDTGGWFWDASAQRYVKTLSRSFEDLCREPHVVGSTPDHESQRPGSLVGTLFFCERPRLGFSPREQQLLMAALEGESGTDQELADALSVSVSVVKKMWLSIYQRAASLLPEPILAGPSLCSGARQTRRRQIRRRTRQREKAHSARVHPRPSGGGCKKVCVNVLRI